MWRRMVHFPFLAILLFLAAMACLPPYSFANTAKNVLVLNSYSPGYKWTDSIIEGIDDALRGGDSSVRIHLEFMDTKRAFDPEYFRLLYQTYQYKFRKSHFDAIITSDNDAFDFMVQHRDELFPGTPVVFCGVNNFDPSQLHNRRLFTGVNEAPDLQATLDLALKLHPNTRKIVVINDTTTTGRAVHGELMRIIPRYQGRVQFLMLEDVDMPEILRTVENLGPDSLVYFIFFFRDKSGTVFDFDTSISMVAQRCPVPIYGSWDFNLGYGIVGGKLTSGYSQGKTAGGLALRILHGEKAESIPFVMTSPNRYMFDYRQLRRFAIPMSSLPPGSIVTDKPNTHYTINRGIIWGGAVALAALLLTILLLWHNVALKKRGEERLLQANEELEERVGQRTEELENSRAELEEQHRMLQDAYEGLRVESEERIRVMEELRVKDQMLIHQSRMAAMGEMLGNIAHQWRQPLNLLGLMIQDLTLSYKAGKFDRELLDTNVAKAMEILRHLSRTIDDFRTFSTPDKQKVRFNVDEVIAKTLSLVSESFKDQGITIETSSEVKEEIEGYPNEYGQVLLNILMNSKDAFKERAISHGRITVRSWTDNGRTVVSIRDNAGGIDEGILSKIFDAYFTTKEAGKGTGVGLFMSKTIVEKNMGGRLTVRNAGDGVEFRITV